MKTINIITGPVQSGKTTRLIAWVKYHQNSAGILAPIINNHRHIFSIHANESRCLETSANEDITSEIVKVGKYLFSKSVFEWAHEQLDLATKLRKQWLIIDEIGPLELKGYGLEPMVSQIIQQYVRSKRNRLILVVRENLLQDVVQHYNLKGEYQRDTNFLNIG